MNKIIKMEIVLKRGDSENDYFDRIIEGIEKLQEENLEVEVQYSDNSTLLIGRKVVYNVEEL